MMDYQLARYVFGNSYLMGLVWRWVHSIHSDTFKAQSIFKYHSLDLSIVHSEGYVELMNYILSRGELLQCLITKSRGDRTKLKLHRSNMILYSSKILTANMYREILNQVPELIESPLDDIAYNFKIPMYEKINIVKEYYTTIKNNYDSTTLPSLLQTTGVLNFWIRGNRFRWLVEYPDLLDHICNTVGTKNISNYLSTTFQSIVMEKNSLESSIVLYNHIQMENGDIASLMTPIWFCAISPSHFKYFTSYTNNNNSINNNSNNNNNNNSIPFIPYDNKHAHKHTGLHTTFYCKMGAVSQCILYGAAKSGDVDHFKYCLGYLNNTMSIQLTKETYNIPSLVLNAGHSLQVPMVEYIFNLLLELNIDGPNTKFTVGKQFSLLLCSFLALHREYRRYDKHLLKTSKIQSIEAILLFLYHKSIETDIELIRKGKKGQPIKTNLPTYGFNFYLMKTTRLALKELIIIIKEDEKEER